MTLQIDVWAWKIIRQLFSMLLQALCIISFPLVNSNWSYSPATSNLGQIRRFVELCDLEIWCLTLKNKKAPLLCHFKLCASLRNHWWIQTGVTVRECPIWVKFDDLFSHVTLKFDGWHWKNNRAPLLCNIKLCASFHRHMWIQTGVTVRKRQNGVMTSVTVTFNHDLLHAHYLGQW